MKKKSKLIGSLAFVLTFVAGYALGLLLDMPNIDSNQASGTIGRVNNYRNAKATEKDIALKEGLLNDKKQQEAMVNYLNYYYAKSLAYAQTTAFALEQAAAVPAFTSACDKLDAMKEYGQFLETSRKLVLMASLHCQSVESADPSALRNSLNQASNMIARMNQYQPMLITFMDQLDDFLLKNGSKNYTGLSQVHDQLLFDQVGSVLMSKDKVLANYLSNKRMYAADAQDKPVDVKAALLLDVKTLDASYPRDMEKLGYWDKESLGLKDTEELGFWDNEKLLGALLYDVEQLGSFWDAEKLGAGFTDAEKLGTGFTDVEKLGTGFTDAEKLGVGFFDAEKLGRIMALDSETLGLIEIE